MKASVDEVVVACESAAAGRDTNQDRCAVHALDPRRNLWGLRGLILVADGMGGHENGEVAAQLAADLAVEVLAASPEEHERLDAAFLGGDAPEVVSRLFALANERIHERAAAEGLAGNMGTTLTLVLLDEEGAVVGHVGDSKAFLVGAEGIEKISEEHSWVGERVRDGLMTEEEAAVSPLRSHLTQAVGADTAVEPDIRRVSVKPGDVLLACSDGLTEVVSPAAIGEVTRAAETPAEACRKLVEMAVEGEATDNVTVAMMVVPGAPPQEEAVVLPAAPGPTATEEPAPEPAPSSAVSPPGDADRVEEGSPMDRRLVERLPVLGAVCLVALAVGLLAGQLLFPATAPPPVATAPPVAAPAPGPPTPAALPTTPADTAAFRVEARCDGKRVVLSASEAVAYSVYTQATRQDLPPAADGPAGEKRFRLRAEPPAAWLKASVVLEIRRLGQGRLSIKPTPANLQVFVDKKPLKGPQLAEVETQAPHARIGFYFPPGGGPGALGVAITDFAVETEQPNAEANAATPAAEPPTPPQ